MPLLETLVSEEVDNLAEDMSAYFTDASLVQGSAIAQDVLEPVLRAQVEQTGSDLRYATELVDFAQDEEGITATIRERASGKTRRVHAAYLVAADGGQSGIRQQLGIERHGPGPLFHCISLIFEADLMDYFRRRQAVMCFVSNDTVTGGFVPYAGSSVRPNLFRLDVAYDPEMETSEDYPEERCLQLIRAAIGIADFPVTLKTVLAYSATALVADHFQQGRIFLVGDAARTQPPSGALGGNTGIAEAHNLAWKLAAVLRGEAGLDLLTTYDAERRPLADYTVEQVALLSQERETVGSEGITVDTLSINMGFSYHTGAIIQEQQVQPENLPLSQHPGQWKGLPGTRAPHLIIERQGQQISTLDLYGQQWVLLVGPEGQSWREAGQHIAEQLNMPLGVHQFGAELIDVGGTFQSAYGIIPSGAVLVRPDGMIAWRSQGMRERPEQVLAQAFARLLCRESKE